RSVLAVIVRGRSGDVLGSLFFGTSRADAFTDQHERLAVGIASWASVALENALLYIEAQEANRMKDEFLAVLSHELRTPLNAIVGYARLLRGGILTGDQVGRGLETLERNANWLTQIVEDVLDVSRIVSGRLRLEIQPVALAPVVENAVATVQPAADAKGIAIVSALDAQAGLVPGDPDRLQQVAWNLLSNAVKFTPSGGRIHVRLDRVGALAELVVSDSGSGISQDFLPYVFERFRQADTGPTRKTGGLGLGLAIVRHIVEMHGGTVQATSGGEGRGATFRVRLPLMQALRRPEQPRAGHLSPALASPLSGLSDLSGVRVAAIDDEEDALQLLRIMLEAAGAAVDIFRSPRQALSALEASPPDVLVVDLGMPEMDGLEVIRRVRGSRAPRLKDVPAVALTAFARSEDRARALRAGFELHLPKPVDPGDLVAAVERLVHGTRSAG
ncbi:MAG: ATP-binding protein, partial [Vicinamibacterales bacterium]